MQKTVFLWICGAAALLAPGTCAAGASNLFADSGQRLQAESAYSSHYIVFGVRDDSGTQRLLAIDINRTERDDDVAYEYKLFRARGGEWSMPIYETWTTRSPSASQSFPSRGGLTAAFTDEGSLRRITVDLPDLTLEVAPKHPEFQFSTGPSPSEARTAHPLFTVRWNGEVYEGRGVYEWIRSVDAPERPEAAAEADRQLDEERTFGLYDWIVLYDDEGRLWQVSQGTLTSDFGYQQAAAALPAQTRDVLVRWTATRYDETAGRHSPTAWLVDVPGWSMRVSLRKQGEHRGHGPVQSDSTRPIYVQAGVEGRGIIRGEEHQFFGMVEHIRD